MDLSDFLDVTMGNNRRKALLQSMMSRNAGFSGVHAMPVHAGIIQHLLGPQAAGAPQMTLPIQLPSQVVSGLGAAVAPSPVGPPAGVPAGPIGGALQNTPAPVPSSPYAGLPTGGTGAALLAHNAYRLSRIGAI